MTKEETVLTLKEALDKLTEPILAGIDIQAEALTKFTLENDDFEFLLLSVAPDYILNGQKYTGADKEELVHEVACIYSFEVNVAQDSTDSLIAFRIDVPYLNPEELLKTILAKPDMLVEALVHTVSKQLS